MPLHELQLFWIDQALIIEYLSVLKICLVLFFFGKSMILAQEHAEIQSFIMSNYDYLGGIKYIKHSLINCCNLSICNLSFTHFSKPHILQFRYVSPLCCLMSCIHLNDQTFLCIFYFCNFHARLLFERIVTFLMLVGGVIQTDSICICISYKLVHILSVYLCFKWAPCLWLTGPWDSL